MVIADLEDLINAPFEPEREIDYAINAYRFYVMQLRLLMSNLNEQSEKIVDIARRILKSDMTIPVAAGRSKILSGDLYRKLTTNIGLPVKDPGGVLNINVYKNPVPIVISTTARTKEPRDIAEQFYEKRDIRPILITATIDKTDLTNYAGGENIISTPLLETEIIDEENSYALRQLFDSTIDDPKREIQKYCPLGNLGELSSAVAVSHLLATIACIKFDLNGWSSQPNKYGEHLVNEVYKELLKYYPTFIRRRDEFDSISRTLAQSDFIGLVGEEYSENVVKSLGMRLYQLPSEKLEKPRDVFVFNSGEANPLYSYNFGERHDHATIFANSGRGSSNYTMRVVDDARVLRERVDSNKLELSIVGMTFTPNSSVYRRSDIPVVLNNTNIFLSPNYTIFRTYEPLSIVVTDSLIPTTAIYSGVSLEEMHELMQKRHNVLGI